MEIFSAEKCETKSGGQQKKMDLIALMYQWIFKLMGWNNKLTKHFARILFYLILMMKWCICFNFIKKLNCSSSGSPEVLDKTIKHIKRGFSLFDESQIYIYAPKFLSRSQGDFAPFFVKAGITPVQHINNSLLWLKNVIY